MLYEVITIGQDDEPFFHQLLCRLKEPLRVGNKVARGLPAVWDWVKGRISPWFEANGLK